MSFTSVTLDIPTSWKSFLVAEANRRKREVGSGSVSDLIREALYEKHGEKLKDFQNVHSSTTSSDEESVRQSA